MQLQTSKLVPSYLALESMRNLVSHAQRGLIYLFQGEEKILHLAIQELINRFALQEPVQVVAGGNRVSFDQLPRLVGEQAADIYEIMDRVRVSRAETCYQMLDALAAMQPSPSPVIITDMLESFYEKDLAPAEVDLILKKCLVHIRELSRTAPVLISASREQARPNLMNELEHSAGTHLNFQTPQKGPTPRQSELPGFY